MKGAVVFAVLGLVACSAVAQLARVNNIGKTDATKIASALVIGMPVQDAMRLLAQRGLSPGASFQSTNLWTEHYGLTNGLLVLHIARKQPGDEHGILRGAFVVSSAVHSSPGDTQVARTNAPNQHLQATPR